jgi:broad specificity phosphatase PhoE
MNTIYLVRHGENPANLTKEFSCRHVDYPLTDKGILQAQQTAAWFADKNIDEIYASPLRRAKETAQWIAAAVGLSVEIMENFREVNVGEFELEPPTAEKWDAHNHILRQWVAGQTTLAFPGGEDYLTMWERMRSGLARIVAGKSGRKVVIVGHAGIFSLAMKDLCPTVDLARLWAVPSHNCSITTLAVSQPNGHLQAELLTWAAHDHLHGPAARFVSPLPE